MRCLWLTLADPEPRHNGEFIYSGGLIDAAAQAGVELDVLATARGRLSCSNGTLQDGVRWWLIDQVRKPPWTSLMSPLPHLAHRAVNAAKHRKLAELLQSDAWDGIVFDGVSTGWALDYVVGQYDRCGKRPRTIYISHNHETTLRERIADVETNVLMRKLRKIEAGKVSRLERRMIHAADVITAITPEDRSLYLERYPRKRFDVLTPGYDGRELTERRITHDLPRRAVIVGSYDWIAKRINLEDFLTVADPLIAAAGAELYVVGSAEEATLARWRRRFCSTRFTGAVDRVAPFMDQARVAIVPELLGGGFKLKVLDYVFNRMPILALAGSVAGVPLRHGENILEFSDHEALARGMIASLDDLDQLNRLQDRAYAACCNKFQWRSRGHFLQSAIARRP